LSTQLDTSTDISAFGPRRQAAAGARPADVLVSTRATEQYYQRLQAQLGPSQVDSLRALLRGGRLGPCGEQRLQRDLGFAHRAGAMVREGHAPKAQVTTDTPAFPGRKRPLCDYPKWPQYKGTGDVNVATSFQCVN
jgi:hypothetical protein